jgi:hypothetical protein
MTARPETPEVSDLRAPNVGARWNYKTKGRVCAAIIAGAVSRELVVLRYGLSEEELDGWLNAYRRAGALSLRIGNGKTKRAAPVAPPDRDFEIPPPPPALVKPKARFLSFLANRGRR